MTYANIEQAIKEFRESKQPLAFRYLYDCLSKKLYYVALLYLKEEDAQDVLQETFVTVYHKFDMYTGEGSFEGWIKRILINRCLQKLRIDKKESLQNVENYQLENIAEEYFDVNEQEFTKTKLLESLKELPDNYRAVINLAVLEDFSHKEIAQALNITENNSRALLLRAKVLLKEKLTLANVLYGVLIALIMIHG